MKVLFLVQASYPDGPAAAKLIQRLAVGLVASGVACEVLCLEKSSSLAGDRKRDRYGITYFGLPTGGSRLARRIRGFTLAKKLRAQVEDAILRQGVTHVWVYNPSWLLWRQVIRFCEKNNTPVVAHLTEWWSSKHNERMLYFDQQLFLRYSWPFLTGIVGISMPWMDYARQKNMPAVRVPVPCPVNNVALPESDLLSPRLGDSFTIVYSGILCARDMPEVMLGAIRKVVSQNRFVKMIVLGRTDVVPEGRAFCQAVASDPQLSDRITITGFLSDSEYAKQIARADAFLLLHADTWESRACFPTRLPEHLTTGKPVIVSGVGDIPHYLRDGIDALVLSPNNTVDELSSAILRLANNPEFSAKLGAAGRARSCDVFSSTKLGLQLKTFLSSLRKVPILE